MLHDGRLDWTHSLVKDECTGRTFALVLVYVLCVMLYSGVLSGVLANSSVGTVK